MKKLTLVIAMAVFGTACVANNGDSPIRITGAFAPKPDCTLQTDIQQGGGSYDLAAIRPAGALAASFAEYLTMFSIESDLVVPNTSSNGHELADDSRNRVYIDQIILNYDSTPPLTFQQDVVDIYAPIDAKGGLNMLTNLLGPKAAQTLLDNVQPGSQPVDVRITMQLRGQSASGNSIGSNFFSNKVKFPVTFFDSGTTCGAGTVLSGSGPCGNIQDGRVFCAALDAGTP